MYAEAGIQLPPSPGFSDGFFDDYSSGHCSYLLFSDEGFHSPGFGVGVEDGPCNMANMVQAPSVSEYDMGGEGDLFNALEPILEDPALDPVVNAMSVESGGGHVITETIKAADIESTQNDHLSDIYSEETISDLLEVKILLAETVEVPPSKKINCAEGTILDKSQIEETISELLEVKIPAVEILGVPPPEKVNCVDILIHKSASSESLSSLEWIPSSTRRPAFLDFQGLDFEAALGLRRACSEGDIENLGSKSANSRNTTSACSSFDQLLSIDNKTEQRLQKLSRYREKKSKRNFARQIKKWHGSKHLRCDKMESRLVFLLFLLACSVVSADSRVIHLPSPHGEKIITQGHTRFLLSGRRPNAPPNPAADPHGVGH